MDIDISDANLGFLTALASRSRVRILRLLGERPMNIGELSAELGVSSAIVTKHIQMLERAKIVKSENLAGRRGMQKLCRLNVDKVTLHFRPGSDRGNRYRFSIPVGQYSTWSVRPTCGLANRERPIGMIDDPRYFADPGHIEASMLWFGNGYVEYSLPNYLLGNQTVTGLRISLEICSEAPGYNENWPSDIVFSVNGVRLGAWTSPGDFGAHPGSLTPGWWNYGTTHGLLKTITVSAQGSFIDGVKLSPVCISELGILCNRRLVFRVACEESAAGAGGVSLFGRYFGNYPQDIDFVIDYEQRETERV